MPKVTVLMPVYNAEKYLREAIESILDQSFQDYEFLIIDDGSTDSSINIINSYHDSRIKLVKNEKNLGISKTLNKGIELSASDIIARMDADDISLPNRLWLQYEYLESHPDCSLVSSHAEIISDTGRSIGKYQPDSNQFYYNLVFHCWIYHPSVMYRREAIRDAGMYPLTLAEDYRLWSELIKKYPFYNIPRFLIRYRITSESVSNSAFAEEYRDAEKKQIIENLQYFMGKDYTIPDAWLECYRNNYDPLCNPPKVGEMVKSIRELDVITLYILAKENINRDPAAIKLAAEQKKERIFESLLKRVSTVYKVQLLARTGNVGRLRKLLMTWTFGKIKKFSFSF